MSEIFLNAVSGAAFAAFLICFAALRARAPQRRSDDGARNRAEARRCERVLRRSGLLSPALCAAAFYFVPVGSLPPFFSFEYGGFAVAVLMLLSAFARPRSERRLGSFFVVFCAAWGASALFVSSAGVPGALGCLGTYSVMPLWSVSGAWGRAGMSFLFLALLCAFPENAGHREEGCASLRFADGGLRPLLYAALTVALLLPWNPSVVVGAGGVWGFFCDFVFFWVKAAAVCAAAGFAPRFAAMLTRGRSDIAPAAFALCGVVCVVAEARLF